MPKAAPFEEHHERYDAWFGEHAFAYLSELLALRPFVPWQGRGLEIGVGTGRFAAPLGVGVGLDPAPAMLAHAAARGIEVVEGVAEHLPFADHSFDHALLVTTLCFLDAPDQALREARRVLTPDGRLVIGFVDRNSALGQLYAQRREQSLFYREATFRSAEEVEQLLLGSGFAIEAWGQTLAQAPDEMCEIDPLRPGHGQCPFVVVAASPACAPSEVSLAGWVRAPEERPGSGAGLARRADRFTGPG